MSQYRTEIDAKNKWIKEKNQECSEVNKKQCMFKQKANKLGIFNNVNQYTDYNY